MTVTPENTKQAQRKAAMAVLAHSDPAEISGCLDAIALPVHENLREPENGLLMVRGRIGGDRGPFNLSEATGAGAGVRPSHGEGGFCYTLGADRGKCGTVPLLYALVPSNEI